MMSLCVIMHGVVADASGIVVLFVVCWGAMAQSGSAFEWHSKGQWFKST